MKVPTPLKWLLVIIALLALILLERSCNKSADVLINKMHRHWEDSVNKSYAKILKQKDDSLFLSRQSESAFRDSVSYYKGKLIDNSAKIVQIRTVAKAKVDVVNRLTSDELSKFFIARYDKVAKVSIGKINPAQLISLPDSILRPAANDVLLSDQLKAEIEVNNTSFDYLNQIITFKDSVINEKDKQVALKDGVINIKDGQIALKQSDNDILKKKYSHLKVNDRLKMGLGAGIIATLGYLIIAK